MPLQIVNNQLDISMNTIVELMRQGYSVVKSPHVGNQHPSNLVCAKLGIPLSMVTFTLGERDTNFHPHLRIEGGQGTEITNPSCWTPFARMACGTAVESFHQSELKARFPDVQIQTDIEIIQSETAFAEVALRSVTGTFSDLWYRKVDANGVVTKIPGRTNVVWDEVKDDIYRFTNTESGWVIPNRAHIIFELALQSLSSGRDVVYHLAGPQMNSYIGKIQNSLTKGYDALRAEWPELPETLTVYIVPVAACRMISHKSKTQAVDAINGVLQWYEGLNDDEKRHSNGRLKEVISEYPEFVQPIEDAQCMSQYDVSGPDDLVLSEWMLCQKLGRVTNMHGRLCRLAA